MHLQSAQSISGSSCPIKRAFVSPSAGRRCGFLGRPPWISRASLAPASRLRGSASLGVVTSICGVCLFARAPPRFQIPPFERLSRTSDVPCAPFSTPSWPPRFPSSQVRPPRLLGRKLDRGGGLLLAWLCRVGAGWGRPIGAERSQMPFFWNDLVWSAAIGLVLAALAPALPNQFAQTDPTSSMARSATLKRRPASSVINIVPYAIVTAALSHLAGSSPPAPRPCMHGHHGGLGHPGTGRD